VQVPGYRPLVELTVDDASRLVKVVPTAVLAGTVIGRLIIPASTSRPERLEVHLAWPETL